MRWRSSHELAASRVLYVRIRSLNTARSSAEFQLDGSQAAIEAGLAGCPITPEAARRGRAPAKGRPAT